ncbi:trypsin-1-like isoform X2 [Daphnia pulicaria]|uniref:trypsin-1-like isoform X1 n=1 Tax=Daphnia pulicaria TaxID=35523 RepID=UPI001EE9CEF2|nr:trypsin-1-like isoform X1 [Daphnia pulicaria]XP_046638364.1 trypsin-1-like isoform X2 [Daphnia pulicaria]
MRLILLAMGLFSLVGLATSKNVAGGNVPSVSIVGGIPAALGEFPYVAGLTLGSTFICGGILIGPFHVLTAGHCLYGKSQTSANTFTVRLNTLAYSGSTAGIVIRGVKKIIIHPNYNPSTFENDLILLVLNQTVTNVSTISFPSSATAATTTTTTKPSATTKVTTPFCSCTCAPPTTKSKVSQQVKTTKKPSTVQALSGYANMNAVIAGWGTTSFGGSLSSTLLKANVTILANSKCAAQYGSTFVGANMLCAAAPGTDTCQGDSGGPVIVNGVVVGITSFGVGCADPKYAGVYTRVSTYVGWIKTTRANNPG